MKTFSKVALGATALAVGAGAAFSINANQNELVETKATDLTATATSGSATFNKEAASPWSVSNFSFKTDYYQTGGSTGGINSLTFFNSGVNPFANTPTSIIVTLGVAGGSAKSNISGDFYLLDSTGAKITTTKTTKTFSVERSSADVSVTFSSSLSAAYGMTFEFAKIDKWNLRLYSGRVQYTYAASSDPAIVITNKESGTLSQIIGDQVTLTTEIANGTGMTTAWSSDDATNTIITLTNNVFVCNAPGTAVITVQLKDGETIKASDTVTITVLQPSLSIDGITGASASFYTDDTGTFQVTKTNSPNSATVSWASSDENVMLIDASTGEYVFGTVGTATLTANLIYSAKTIATSTASITVKALSTPTLVITKGTGTTDIPFGQGINTTGWTATYTSNHGTNEDVLSRISWDSGFFKTLGKHTVTGTYNGLSSSIEVNVTNKGAISSGAGSSTVLSGKSYANWTADGASTYPSAIKFSSKADAYSCSTIWTGNNAIATAKKVAVTLKLYGNAATGADTTNTVKVDILNGSASVGSTSVDITSKASNDYDFTVNTLSSTTITGVKISLFSKKDLNIGLSSTTITPYLESFTTAEQAEAYRNVLQTYRACFGGWTETGGVNSRAGVLSLTNEYNWMESSSKTAFASLQETVNDYDNTDTNQYIGGDSHTYGTATPTVAGVNALQKLKMIVKEYNASLASGETPLSLTLPDGTTYSGSANIAFFSTQVKDFVLPLVTFLGATGAIALIFISKKKKQQ